MLSSNMNLFFVVEQEGENRVLNDILISFKPFKLIPPIADQHSR